MNEIVDVLNSNYIKVPESGIEDLSDGYHTFKQLYYQRMMLFAALVKQNKDRSWKSLRHEDGELCFGGGWFIVGIDTPEGSYTYHYEESYYSLFDCKELKCAKHWDGHIEKDVTRLLSLPTEPPFVSANDLISRQAAIEAFNEYLEEYGEVDENGLHDLKWCAMREAKVVIEDLPSAQPDDWLTKNKDRILQAGMEGKEVEFRIGGRLFAIREKAQ